MASAMADVGSLHKGIPVPLKVDLQALSSTSLVHFFLVIDVLHLQIWPVNPTTFWNACQSCKRLRYITNDLLQK